MKSLAELAAIRDKMRQTVATRDDKASVRVVVGMATCGIAAGARPVLAAFVEGVNDAGLNSSVTVSQTGCIGVCRLEPIVEVFVPGQEKVTYVKVKPDMVASIVEQHLVNQNVLIKYTIGAAE